MGAQKQASGHSCHLVVAVMGGVRASSHYVVATSPVKTREGKRKDSECEPTEEATGFSPRGLLARVQQVDLLILSRRSIILSWE
ncbi:hypothetical protein JOB18_016005 [Solea senegalensis]|uniref:Uncharacterized protein n=1 Tax=Solea senegalensis TaxID=28829 RepID=A0AAV6QSB8_SOLSE|nr:hypothetical protein JOB18_016005 [Solea senegalensis]